MKEGDGSAGRLHREMEIAPGPPPMNSNFQEMCAFPLPHLLLSLLRLTPGNDLQDDESCMSTVGLRSETLHLMLKYFRFQMKVLVFVEIRSLFCNGLNARGNIIIFYISFILFHNQKDKRNGSTSD